MKLVVDQSTLTLAELVTLEELLGCSLSDAFTASQARAIAALACVVARRDQPGFSFDDALALKMSDLELVAADPEVPGGGNGVKPRPSPASGPSTRSKL